MGSHFLRDLAATWPPDTATHLELLSNADQLDALRAEVERLREAVLSAYRKGHHHTVNGGYQWCDQGGREVVEEIIREALEE
jgi:hypothetical protein